MRDWWRDHVEYRLNRLPINWDMCFLGMCTVAAVFYVLGGR